MHGLLLQFRDGDATLVVNEPEHVVLCKNGGRSANAAHNRRRSEKQRMNADDAKS
jgi:hypothetical protein